MAAPAKFDTATLLERDGAVAQLQELLRGLVAPAALTTPAAPGGPGRCVLLHGEAGVGKSSLLKAAQALAPPQLDWVTGLCEPLWSPTPLGPLLDMLDALPPSLATMVQGGRPVQQVMPEWLAWLRRLSRPLVLVVDDAQWADGASLDLLRFTGRRIEGLRLLLILSYRDDELAAEHPLHTVLAGMPGAATLRLRLQPLSAPAVALAAQRAGRSAQGLHALTQGNPFFLTELLQAPAGALPASVRDAVLARAQRLAPVARHMLELLSMSPLPLELAVLKGLVGETLPGLAECVATGLVHHVGEAVVFRHELARQATASAVAPGPSRALHERLLQALSHSSATRRVHHAQGAGLAQQVLQLAPVAAADAARASAHRQAADLYALALAQCTQSTDTSEHAALCLRLAEQCELFGALARARQACEQAITDYRQQDDRAGLGVSLSRMARLLWLAGDAAAGKRLARDAIQVLESMGRAEPPAGLAMAYAAMAQLHLLDATLGAAREWARRAIQVAESTADVQALVHALNTLGTAELAAADLPEAWAHGRRSLALALEHGWPEHAARAYHNLLVDLLVHRKHLEWPALADEAVAYCDARDLDLYATRLRLRRAFGRIETGQWLQAEHELRALLSTSALVSMDRDQAEHLLARVTLRRGVVTARRYWVEWLKGQHVLNPIPWYAAPSISVAEAAWLLGQPQALLQWVQQALPAAVATGEPWRSGMLAVWLRRLGQLEQLPDIPLAAPCEAELRGDLDAAAQGWADVGNAYEQGLCWLGGDVPQLKRALALFEQLGAAPAASLARRRLRECGELGSLRGRNQATRADALGLTPRERRLVDALAAGLSYRDIAAQWHRSPRTVEHHAQHLLAKLGLASRKDVAEFVRRHV